ncbi:hypothetical protein [Roseococcus sp.]|uniref:hypothetical protein n=1 Tax=Roseococcus sp. TaxID=2109646 RepID=UPI003BAD70EE
MKTRNKAVAGKPAALKPKAVARPKPVEHRSPPPLARLRISSRNYSSWSMRGLADPAPLRPALPHRGRRRRRARGPSCC